MTEEYDSATRRPEGEKVVGETVNAYRAQKLKNGRIRIRSGGLVVTGRTYFEALERYAERRRRWIDKCPEQLKDEREESIHDGHIPLKSVDSSGFTPGEILNAVTIGEREIVVEDINE